MVCIIHLVLLNRKQKEKLVIKLAGEGKPVREIAKLVHMSINDICEIIRKASGDENDSESDHAKLEEKPISKLSPYAQSFYLFREKKRPTDVVIALDLDADTVLKYYQDYLRLNGKYELVNLYHQLGKDLHLFLHLLDKVKEECLTKADIQALISSLHTIGKMQNDILYLDEQYKKRAMRKRQLEQEIGRLKNLRNSLKDDGD